MSAEQVIQRNQDPFAGSLPQGKALPEVVDLSIEDALDRGLKYNLGLYLSDRVTEQTRAARLRALSNLLPVVNGAISESEQKIVSPQLAISPMLMNAADSERSESNATDTSSETPEIPDGAWDGPSAIGR